MREFWRKVFFGIDLDDPMHQEGGDGVVQIQVGRDLFLDGPVRDRSITFPHCDSLILHSPGTCMYCDDHPDWQQYRLGAGIAFSDTDPLVVRDQGLAPCPSIFHRSSAVRDQWANNLPVPS